MSNLYHYRFIKKLCVRRCIRSRKFLNILESNLKGKQKLCLTLACFKKLLALRYTPHLLTPLISSTCAALQQYSCRR